METGLWPDYLGTVRRKGRIRQARPTATALHPDSTDSAISQIPEAVTLAWARQCDGIFLAPAPTCNWDRAPPRWQPVPARYDQPVRASRRQLQVPAIRRPTCPSPPGRGAKAGSRRLQVRAGKRSAVAPIDIAGSKSPDLGVCDALSDVSDVPP